MSAQDAQEGSGIKWVDLEGDKRMADALVNAVRGAAPWALHAATAGAVIAAEYLGVKAFVSAMPPELSRLLQEYMKVTGVGEQTAEFVLRYYPTVIAGAAAGLSYAIFSWSIVRRMGRSAAEKLKKSYGMTQGLERGQETAPGGEEGGDAEQSSLNPAVAGLMMEIRGGFRELLGGPEAMAREIIEKTTAYLVKKGASVKEITPWVKGTAALIPQAMGKAAEVEAVRVLYGRGSVEKPPNIAEIAFVLQHMVATEVARGERPLPRQAERLTEGRFVTEAVMNNADKVVRDSKRREVLSIVTKAILGFDPQEEEGGSVIGRVMQRIKRDPQLAQKCRESREALLKLLKRSTQ